VIAAVSIESSPLNWKLFSEIYKSCPEFGGNAYGNGDKDICMTNPNIETPKIKAVLFDLDGTIGGINWDLELERKFILDLARKYRVVAESEDLMELIEEVRMQLKHNKEMKEYMRKLLEFESSMLDTRGVEMCPGAREIVRAVKFNGVKTAIVSNNFHENATRVIESFGLTAYFDAIICYDDVLQPKPSPEGINEALRRLKVKPYEALFAGDTESDFLASRAAGVEAVIFPSGKIGENREKILGRI